jgi:hypothetical protein
MGPTLLNLPDRTVGFLDHLDIHAGFFLVAETDYNEVTSVSLYIQIDEGSAKTQKSQGRKFYNPHKFDRRNFFLLFFSLLKHYPLSHTGRVQSRQG